MSRTYNKNKKKIRNYKQFNRRRNIMVKRSIVPILVLIFALAACAGTQSKEDFLNASYKTIASMAIAHSAAKGAAIDLYQANFIDEVMRATINKAARTFQQAYHDAIDVLEKYEKDSATYNDSVAVVSAVISAMGKIAGLLLPYQDKIEPEIRSIIIGN
jgi:hypothetical protein